MKGLKKRDVDDMDEDDATLVDEEEAATSKRARRA
jgi:hypothetical protein